MKTLVVPFVQVFMLAALHVELSDPLELELIKSQLLSTHLLWWRTSTLVKNEKLEMNNEKYKNEIQKT